MIERILQFGRWYGMEINMGKYTVMRISRQPSHHKLC
jgi:hypothetical protein